MPKKLLCFLLIIACFSLVSCSLVSNLLEKVGLGDVKDKLDTAWSEVGKEVLDNLTDSLWREYGFGKSLEWPKDGNGAHVPKLRSGATKYSFASEDGSCGCIYMSDISEENYKKYVTELTELGYKQSLSISQLKEVYVCDGLYIGLLKTDDTLYICYGKSVTELDDVYNAAAGAQEE